MTRNAIFSLKYRIVAGLSTIVLIAAAVVFYSSHQFSLLEQQMRYVNEDLVPMLKALNQVEGYLFSYEQDLDHSLVEAQAWKPKNSQFQLLEGKIKIISDAPLGFDGENKNLSIELHELQNSFNEFSQGLEQLFGDFSHRALYEESLTKARANFKHQLHVLIRDTDQEIRLSSVSMQNLISKTGIVLTILLFATLVTMLVLGYWIRITLRPFENLTSVTREISQKGLQESHIHALAEMQKSLRRDEVFSFIQEFSRMANHLLEQTKQLEIQKNNLSMAHKEMAQQNEALKKTRSQLQHKEKLALVGQLSAQMAHEIRNPLNALGLQLELMEQEWKQGSDISSTIQSIKSELDRLDEVSLSYLNHARAPKMDSLDECDLNGLIESTVHLYEPILKEKNIVCTYQLDQLPKVHVDKKHVAQIFNNLLKNAYESFEEKDTDTKKFIRIFSKFNEKKNELELCFADNGAGISAEVEKDIFSPFFTTKAEGTGLGLAQSKQIMDEYGGDIRFNSTPGKGTSFWLRFPTKQEPSI